MSVSQNSSKKHTITCYFINKDFSDAIAPTDIEIDSKHYDRSSLRSTIKKELLTQYPGIGFIDLFVSRRIYTKLFSSNDKQLDAKVCISNKDFEIEEKDLGDLSEVFIVITKIYGEEDFTTIQKVKCTYQTPEGIDKSIYLLFPDISITIDAFREAFSIFFNGEVEIDFFDNKSNKLNITEVTDKTITKNRLQFYFVNLATIIDKYLKNALSLDVFLSFIFKDKKVEPLKFSNFDCFKKKDICAFSNTRIYCGFDEKSPTYEEIKKKFDMKLGDPCHLAFSGRSGCGKSAMIAELSKTYPVIYLDLNLQTTIKNNLIDCFPDYCKKLKT